MVAGHLRKQNGIYQMILCYKDTNNKRCSKSISTGLPSGADKERIYTADMEQGYICPYIYFSMAEICST